MVASVMITSPSCAVMNPNTRVNARAATTHETECEGNEHNGYCLLDCHYQFSSISLAGNS